MGEAALKLDPAERFLLLAQLLDDVAAPTPDTVRAVVLASMTVLRQVQGRATDAEARFAVERARAALYDARLPHAETGADRGSTSPALNVVREGQRGTVRPAVAQEEAEGQSTSGSASPPKPRTRRICVVLAVDVDRHSDAYLRKNYRGVLRVEGRLVEVPGELRRLCAEYRARGFEAFPCDHADERGHCRGYEVSDG